MTDRCPQCDQPAILHMHGICPHPCPNCKGSGGTYLARDADSWLPCPHCGGSGITPRGDPSWNAQ